MTTARGLLAACIALAAACAPANPGAQAPVFSSDFAPPVYVPASLAGIVAELLPDSRRVVASTVVLARQIERGARPGVVLSASSEWLDYLAARGRLEPGTRAGFARGRLVLVEPLLPTSASRSESPPARFCSGDPAYVPLGQYTRAVFENLGRWESLRKHLLPASDARRARTYLLRGACRLGMLYASDALADAGRLRVVAEVPARLHPPVRYEIALVRSAGPSARAAYDALRDPGSGGESAAELLKRRGFAVDACSNEESVLPCAVSP